MPESDTRCKIHIISNTHWDREWRFSFEETRLRLVEVLDKLLDIFDTDPDYKHFHFDSQTIGIEDYLEVRPENRPRIEQAIQSGRLLVGPWYSLPDEFMVSGESLARNLFIGHQVARDLGKVMKVGYNPFSFCGQNSQIAQLYNGFDIDSIIFYRGIGTEGDGKDFYLEAADGSRVLNIRLTPRTRFNFLYLVGRALYFGQLPADKNKYVIDEGGRICRFAEDQLEARDFDMIRADYQWNTDWLEERMAEFFEDAKKPATTRHLIGMDGYDSAAPSQFTTKIIKLARKLGYDIVHDSLPRTVAAIQKEAPKNLPVVRKEMRYKRGTPIGTLTARYHIKQQNRRAEFDLQRGAEPFSVLAMHSSKHAYPESSLLMAWKTLLANQCHDSIGGCAADKVHRAMEIRFARTMEISRALSKRALMSIAEKLDCRDLPKNHTAVCLFNPLTRERDELIEAYVMVPKEIGLTRPGLFTPEDEAVPCRIVSDQDWTANVEKFSMDVHEEVACQTWRITLNARALPPLGWRTLLLQEDPEGRCGIEDPAGEAAANVMENDHLRVEINANGTLNMRDKSTGREFQGLGYFEDRGERGGPWHSGLVPNDQPITSHDCRAEARVVREDAFASTREVSLRFTMPADVTADEQARTTETVDLPIRTRLTLRHDRDLLEFETTVDNIARSHRLRVMFPSGLAGAKTHEAEGQFDVVSRQIIPIDPTDREIPGGDFIEPCDHAPVSTHPQLSFMDVSDGEAGLAMINSGMCEYEVIDDEPRTIGLTLLRTFPKLKIMHAYMEGREGQCLGEGTFRYALKPHAGNWEQADLHHTAARFNVPVTVLQFVTDAGRGKLPLSRSFLNVEGAVVDCVKKSGRNNNLIVRVHNPHPTKQKYRLTCDAKLGKAWLCNLEEKRQDELSPKKHSLSGSIGPKKILTLELALAPGK